jgi:hypothetical protein
VAIPVDAAPYNVDLVWARIVALLPQAQQIQLNRMMTDSRGTWSVSQILSQAAAGGKALLISLMSDKADASGAGAIPECPSKCVADAS